MRPNPSPRYLTRVARAALVAALRAPHNDVAVIALGDAGIADRGTAIESTTAAAPVASG
jgi:hypothetical protein